LERLNLEKSAAVEQVQKAKEKVAAERAAAEEAARHDAEDVACICPNCGTVVALENYFCGSCGTKME